MSLTILSLVCLQVTISQITVRNPICNFKWGLSGHIYPGYESVSAYDWTGGTTFDERLFNQLRSEYYSEPLGFEYIEDGKLDRCCIKAKWGAGESIYTPLAFIYGHRQNGSSPYLIKSSLVLGNETHECISSNISGLTGNVLWTCKSYTW